MVYPKMDVKVNDDGTVDVTMTPVEPVEYITITMQFEQPMQSVNLKWKPYLPSGYTDDLGIIADKNQWINQQDEGWYAEFVLTMMNDVYKWCDANIKKTWHITQPTGNYKATIFIEDERDAAWFTLKWA